jgi:hypothetical protein
VSICLYFWLYDYYYYLLMGVEACLPDEHLTAQALTWQWPEHLLDPPAEARRQTLKPRFDVATLTVKFNPVVD